MALRLGFAGAKMTGGGAGGVVAVLGFDDQEAAFQQLVFEFARRCGGDPRVFRHSGDGVDRTAISVFSSSERSGLGPQTEAPPPLRSCPGSR